MVQYPGHIFGGFPLLMGVVNVTQDSFSDGGQFINPDKAIEHGIKLVREGAGILDVGGESTRPGAQTIDIEEEMRRVVPVIEGLKGAAPFLSIDTRNSRTMEAALKAGANAVNDISALTHDSRSVDVVSEAQIPVFLTHMQGEPSEMQKNPMYHNVVEEVFEFLQQRISYCDTRRIDARMIVCDPGIGFGKSLQHNLLLLRNIRRFHDLGAPVLLGTSRKSFISSISANEPPSDRLAGSLASVLWGLSQGVQIFRIHDVKETRQAFAIYQAIADSELVSSG